MPRPPQWTPENAARFKDRTVAAAYHLRLPYPPALFERLVDLVPDSTMPVLDLGTGTGELAREVAPQVSRVDAVDASPAMLARAKSMPGGDHPNIRWIESRVEDLVSNEQYGLITAGDSLHWMDWDLVLRQLAHVLVPNGYLAIVHRTELPAPWQDDLAALIARYSTSRFYETFDLIAELERRGLFTVAGRFESSPQTSRQSVDDYVESFHSRSSLSREHMAPGTADAFDAQVRRLVAPRTTDGSLTLTTVGEIIWGRPRPAPPL